MTKEDRRKRDRLPGATQKLEFRISHERKEAYLKASGGKLTRWAFGILDKAAGFDPFNPSDQASPDKTS